MFVTKYVTKKCTFANHQTKENIMTTQSMRHIIAVAMVWLLAVGQTLACTSFIVSGRVTKSGRPMIFKNRDTGNLDNCMVAMQGERYRFMGGS